MDGRFLFQLLKLGYTVRSRTLEFLWIKLLLKSIIAMLPAALRLWEYLCYGCLILLTRTKFTHVLYILRWVTNFCSMPWSLIWRNQMACLMFGKFINFIENKNGNSRHTQNDEFYLRSSRFSHSQYAGNKTLVSCKNRKNTYFSEMTIKEEH